MPIKKYEGLTDLQNRLVSAVCDGIPPRDAALKAGYANSESSWTALRLPNVCSAIRNEIARRIVVEGAPLGLSVLIQLAKDDTVLPAVRRACARDLMAMAGHVAPKAAEQGDKGAKPLHEMSSDELRAVVDRLESELAARATPVSAPLDTLQIAKPLNWLD